MTSAFEQILHSLRTRGGVAPWLGLTAVVYLAWLFLGDWLMPKPEDMRNMYVWLVMAHERGLGAVYQWSDAEVEARFLAKNTEYPPLVFVHYYLAQLLPDTFWTMQWPSATAKYLFRLPSLAAQFGLTYLILRPLADGASNRKFSLALGLLILNPALYLLGVTVGQYDILLALLIYAALDQYRRENTKTSALMSAAALLLKPTSLHLFPLMALVFWERKKPSAIFEWAAVFLAAVCLFTLPWTIPSGLSWMTQGFRLALDPEYLQPAPSAFNLWWLALTVVGQSSREFPPSIVLLGTVCFLICLLYPLQSFLGSKGSKNALLRFAAQYFLLYFLICTNVNAKHLAYAMVFASLLAIEEERAIWPALALIPLSIAGLLKNSVDGSGRFPGLFSGGTGITFGALCCLGTLAVFLSLSPREESA